jgi:hypothetical protein
LHRWIRKKEEEYQAGVTAKDGEVMNTIMMKMTEVLNVEELAARVVDSHRWILNSGDELQD